MTADNFYKINNMKKNINEEIARFNEIYKYKFRTLTEQEIPPPAPDAGAVPPGGDVPLPPPPAGDMEAPPADAGAMPPMTDTPPADDVEEVDITDLVNMTKSIKKELDASKQDNSGVINKMDDVFTKLSDLEQKLAAMDNIMARIDDLGTKVELMKPKSPEEKLEMRSLDSYPFNQNPQQFFAAKQDEMRKTGKNEYMLTKNDVENYSKDTIKDTFNSDITDEDDFRF